MRKLQQIMNRNNTGHEIRLRRNQYNKSGKIFTLTREKYTNVEFLRRKHNAATGVAPDNPQNAQNLLRNQLKHQLKTGSNPSARLAPRGAHLGGKMSKRPSGPSHILHRSNHPPRSSTITSFPPTQRCPQERALERKNQWWERVEWPLPAPQQQTRKNCQRLQHIRGPAATIHPQRRR